jgi:predicted nucleic acid-binding protein
MSGDRAWYLDASAIVKLVVREPESAALARSLRRRRTLVSSALSRTEVGRALAPHGQAALRRGRDVLSRIDLVRISDRILDEAAVLQPQDLRSLDAIHLATARQLGAALAGVVIYDVRMAAAAEGLGWTASAPGAPTGS